MPRKIKTDFNKRLGAAIRKHRSLAGMSQADLGAILGVTFQQLQKYESGVNRVSAEKLVEIAKTLNLNPQELIDDASADGPPEGAPSNRQTLEAMRHMARMPEQLQRITLGVINAIARAAV